MSFEKKLSYFNKSGQNCNERPPSYMKKWNSNKPASIPCSSFYGNQSIDPAPDLTSGYATLIATDRFEIILHKYDAEYVEIAKQIQSRSYNATTKTWSFDMSDYKLVFDKISKMKSTTKIKKLPSFVMKCLQQTYKETTIDYSLIERKLLNTLKPFQKETIKFAAQRNGRLLIADEMGLGKTLQSLAIASFYENDWPLLIVATKSMRNQWFETVSEYFSIPLGLVQVVNTGKDVINDSKIVIVTHEIMPKILDKLIDRYFGVLIIDESHIVKNIKTQCTKAAFRLSKCAKRVILLSGTPALSRPSELYYQLAMIDDSFFANFYEFSTRYCDGKMTKFGWNTSGSCNLQELEIILMKKFIIRRTKEQIALEIPQLRREVIHLDERICSDDIKALNLLAENYTNQKALEKHSALLGYFSHTATIKTVPVCSYLSKVLNKGVKFLVFAHHQVMINAVEKLVISTGKKYIKIDGKTSSDNRIQYVENFQEDEDYVCAILSIMAANTGITLTAAEVVIFCELHWNPTVLSQAECRAHRIGQNKQVEVRYLIMSGTSDDVLWPMVQSKCQTLNEVGLYNSSFDNVDCFRNDISNTEQSDLNESCVKRMRISNSVDDEVDRIFGDFDDQLVPDFEDPSMHEISESESKIKESDDVIANFDDDDIYDFMDSIDV